MVSGTVTPPLPVGTVAPNIDDFLVALLRAAVAAGSWKVPTLSATAIPRVDMGFSSRVPEYAKPGTDNASWYEREIVRRHLDEALDRAAQRLPMVFVFRWGVEFTELFLCNGPQDLMVFVTSGPSQFRALGGRYPASGRGLRGPGP